MEYKLFDQFVQTFLVERRDFLSNNGETVLTSRALDECIDRFIVNYIAGSDQNFGEKLSKQFQGASREAKIVFAHASWLYVHSSMAMTGQGKKRAVMISINDLLDYQPRDDIFLDKGGIADPGTAYNTAKPANLRFIVLLFKWILGSNITPGKESVTRAITAACLYGVYGQEKDLIDAFGHDQAQQIKKDYEHMTLSRGDQPRLGIYNFLLNLCEPDYYERIVSFRDKELIAEKLYQPEYGSKQGLNTDDQIYMIKQHLKEKYPDIDPKYLLHDDRIKSLWQSKKPAENYWVFQANPRMYDLIGALREGSVSRWKVSAHRDKIHIGDKVIIWATGTDAGCYALAEVTGELDMIAKDENEKVFYKDESYAQAQPRVEISVTHNLYDRPILRSQIAGVIELADLKVGMQGTNFTATKKQYETLEKLALASSSEQVTKKNKTLIDNPPQSYSEHHSDHPLNLILFGPPGTGKTYNTINKAVAIADSLSEEELERKYRTRKELTARYRKLVDEGRIVFTTFHQSMSYEDFIEGIKPVTNADQGNSLSYEVVPGIFKRFCDKAAMPDENNFEQAYIKLMAELDGYENSFMKLKTPTGREFGISLNSKNNLNLFTGPDFAFHAALNKDILISHILGKNTPEYFKGYYQGVLNHMRSRHGFDDKLRVSNNYVLIIDEINRGNVSQIFGELITLIEPDKRAGMKEALEVTLPYSKEKFSVPSNLYIIGTMNTADRSVEALDTALRRRFSFCEMTPDYGLLAGKEVLGIDLAGLLSTINQRIEGLLDKDHAIGHSYFLRVVNGESTLKAVFFDEIIPLLQEYFYGNFGRIELVLGRGFVKSSPVTQSIFAKPSPDNDEFNDHIRYSLVSKDDMDENAFQQELRILMNESDEAQ